MDNDLEFVKKSLLNFDTKLDKLKSDFSISFGKIELLLEKLANFEQRMDDSNKRVHKRIDSAENRLTFIEHCQNATGCNALSAFIAKREEQLKHYESVINNLDNRVNENSQSLKELQDIPNKVLFRVVVSLVTAGLIGLIAFYFRHKL